MVDMLGYAAAAWLVGPILAVLFWIPVLLYVIARWRSHREGHSDTQLGLKVTLSMFKVVAYQIALAGVFLLLYALMSDAPDETQGMVLRTAAGLLLPSLLVYAIHFLAYNHTNHREMPVVDRLFAGVSLLQTGMVAFVALLVACQMLFQKHMDAEAERLAWSVVITYVLAWIVQGLLFARLSTLPHGAPLPAPGAPSTPTTTIQTPPAH